MPVKLENKGRYPANWREIRAAILARAGGRCEFCGVPNDVYRNRVTGAWTDDLGLVEAWWLDGQKSARIVLTLAHLDHHPEHCEPENLRALCQRCHLRYDAGHHAQTAANTRQARREHAGQLGFDLA